MISVVVLATIACIMMRDMYMMRNFCERKKV